MSDPRFHLHFLGWDAPLLRRAADFLHERYGDVPEAGPVHMEDVLVVVPGRRAGRRLTELLLDGAERRDRALRPPRIVTVASLFEAVRTGDQRLAPSLHVQLAWSHVLRERAPADLTPLLAAPPAPEDRGAWWTLASQLASLRRELLGEDLDFVDVARRVEAGLPDDPERWSLLAELARECDRRLSEAGLRNPHALAREAARSGDVSADGRELCLVGTAELPRTTKRLLAALETPVRALIHAPPEEEEGFRADGTVLESAWLERPLPVEEEHLLVMDRPADQAAAVARALAGTDGRWGPQDVVVGVGDEEVRPHLERALVSLDVPARYAAGVPLERSRPARLLRAASDYLRDRGAEAFAAFVRHPDVGAWLRQRTGRSSEGPWLAELDDHRRRHLPARIPAEGWEAPGAPRSRGAEGPGAGFLLLAEILEELVGPRPALLGPFHPHGGRRPLGRWAGAMLEFLLEVYGREPVDRSRPEGRELVEALVALRETLSRLHELPEALDAPVPAAEALDVVLRESRGAAVPPEPDSRAVELLGWLELRPDDAPAVIATGMNEGLVPEAVQGDPFLPDGLRSALELPDNRRRYARDALAVTTLIHSRPLVRFVAGRRDAAGNPLRPSRLLLATSPGELPRRVLRFVEGDGESPGRAAAVPPLRTPDASDPSGEPFALPPEPEIRAEEPPESLRVTDFAVLLRDPYRYALERVRGLDSVDDTARELDPPAFGTLLHEVLKEFGASEVAGSAREGVIREFVEDALDRRARAVFGGAPLPAVRVQVEQARLRLQAFARAQAERTAEGWRIARVETRPPAPGAPFPDGEGHPFHIRGTIDRVDHHPERGAWALLDYKTGDGADGPEKTHRKGRGDDARWVDLQLPLYRHLLPALEEPVELPVPPAEADSDVLELGYFNLPREAEATGVRVAGWSPEDLAGADEVARQVIAFVRENRFRHDPDAAGGGRDPFPELRGAGILGGAESTGDGAAGEEAP